MKDEKLYIHSQKEIKHFIVDNFMRSVNQEIRIRALKINFSSSTLTE